LRIWLDGLLLLQLLFLIEPIALLQQFLLLRRWNRPAGGDRGSLVCWQGPGRARLRIWLDGLLLLQLLFLIELIALLQQFLLLRR
jgi:hypothetical protein